MLLMTRRIRGLGKGGWGRAHLRALSVTSTTYSHVVETIVRARAACPQRRSSNASSLGGQDSAWVPQLCATFQGDNLRRHF